MATAGFSTRAVVALDALDDLSRAHLTTQEVIERSMDRVTGVVDAEMFFVCATDPDSGLSLGAGLAGGLDTKICQPFWEHEFLVPDFNKFSDLTPENPVADLRRATGGRLSRSARFRAMRDLDDLEDEVRASLFAGNRVWGTLQLNRHSGGAPFDQADLDFLRAGAPMIGAALRRALLSEPGGGHQPRGPGVIVLDGHGDVVHMTAEASAWIDELYPAGGSVDRTFLTISLAALTENGTRPHTMRLRTQAGVWLVAHASPLEDSGFAIVLQPAKASEVAPIVVEAYGLTPRETDIARRVARGLSTAQIADELFLSGHTIRDRLKTIFEKVGVSSRGELTHKLFTDHHQPPMNDAIVESGIRAV